MKNKKTVQSSMPFPITEPIVKDLIKFYNVCLVRNEALEEFMADANTLGGTFEGGWIGTEKGEAIIKDKKWREIKKVKLKEIWVAYQARLAQRKSGAVT